MAVRKKRKTTKAKSQAKPRKTRHIVYSRLDPEELLEKANSRSVLSHGMKFQPEFVPQASKLYRKGWTDREVADFFGVNYQTILNWVAACPEFARVRKDSKEVADERVERSLYERALGYEIETEKVFHTKDTGIVRAMTRTHIPAEVTAQRYWLENRQRGKWRNRQEITGADGSPLVEAGDAPKRPTIEIARMIVYMLQRAEDAENGGPQPLLIEGNLANKEG